MEKTLIDLSEITEIEMDGVSPRDYPDFCDAFISAAIWKDSGKSLTHEELERIDPLIVNDLVHSRLF
jgi:hypothetical protein